MTSLIRGAVLAVALTMPAMFVAVVPASAGPAPGPSIRKLDMKWIPGTGSVRVTAVAACEKRVANASWRVVLGQDRVRADKRVALRCDGRGHRVRFTLDPKKGRFRPGRTALAQESMGCTGDVCWISHADGWSTIDRPGHAKGPRGTR